MKYLTKLLSRNLIALLVGILLTGAGSSSLSAQSYPGSNFLGKSVNLLKGEAKPGSRSLIANLSDDEIDYLRGGSYETHTSVAEDITEAANKYSVGMGIEANYGAFSAKADMKLSKEVKERSKTKIVIITKDLTTATLSLKSRTYNLASEFQQALNDGNVSARELFNNYGTHITLGLKVGGRVTGIFSSKENTRESNQQLDVTAEASYGGVTGNTSYSQSSSNSNTSIRINQSWIIKGGASGAKAALESRKNPENYEYWANSTESAPGFFAFTELKPIWELASDYNRQQELEQAFKLLFTKKSLENPERFVFESAQKNNISTQTLGVPEGYKILSGGARVNWAGGNTGNMLTASYPQNLRNWVASHKDHHVSDYSSITLFAMAVYDPFDLLDVKILEKTSPQEVKVIEVKSMAYRNDFGYALVGGGARAVYDGAGSIITGSYPRFDGEMSYWMSNSMDHLASDPSSLTSYAIFVKFKGNTPYQIQTRAFEFDSGVAGVNQMDAGVGSGYHLVGGGAYTRASNGNVTQNFLTASYPEGNRWHAVSKDHHVGRPAILKVFAIGIKVVE